MPHRAPGAPKGRKRFLGGKPIRYYRPKGSAAVRTLIDEGFQAFNAARLGEACRIFGDKMLAKSHDTTIALTVAGAMTPAGLGGCVIALMERGLIDFVISTGANLYHDLHYALNFTLRRGSPFVDDRVLYKEGVIRIYDVLFPAQVLLDTDRFIRDFLVSSELDGSVSSAEFHEALGRHLLKVRPGCAAYSVVASAAKLGVPIYTSSPGDSSIGMNLAFHELINGSRLQINPSKDVNEVARAAQVGMFHDDEDIPTQVVTHEAHDAGRQVGIGIHARPFGHRGNNRPEFRPEVLHSPLLLLLPRLAQQVRHKRVPSCE